VPEISGPANPNSADSVLETIAAMTGALGLYVCLGESSRWERRLPAPELLCGSLVVASVKVEAEPEFCVGVEIRSNPANEDQQQGGIGIGYGEIIAGLGALRPVQGCACSEEGLFQQSWC
jgi:hypothetical protein